MEKATLKFELVLSDLENRLRRGEFSEIGKIPTETNLALHYNCSRPTIRKALKGLKEKGLIHTTQGSGTTISNLTKDAEPNNPGNLLFGLIFQDLGPQYVFDTICNNLATIVSDFGYSLVYGGYFRTDSRHLDEHVEIICKRYIELGVNGVFFAPFEYSPIKDRVNHYIISTLSSAGIAVVLIDGDVDEFPNSSKYDLVSLDHIHAGYLLCLHLLEQKAKRIIFFAPPNSAHTIKLRKIGYQAALFDHEIFPCPSWFVECNPSDTQRVREIIDEIKPEAFLCSNDGCAINLIETLFSLSLEVPKDVLVAGFDNLSYVSKIKVPLTSLSQPTRLISEEATRLMFQRIKEPNSQKKTICFQGDLVIRKSSKK